MQGLHPPLRGSRPLKRPSPPTSAPLFPEVRRPLSLLGNGLSGRSRAPSTPTPGKSDTHGRRKSRMLADGTGTPVRLTSAAAASRTEAGKERACAALSLFRAGIPRPHARTRALPGVAWVVPEGLVVPAATNPDAVSLHARRNRSWEILSWGNFARK